MFEFIKRLFSKKQPPTPTCDHDWRWYKVPPEGQFTIISGEYRVRACHKCETVDDESKTLFRYN